MVHYYGLGEKSVIFKFQLMTNSDAFSHKKFLIHVVIITNSTTCLLKYTL